MTENLKKFVDSYTIDGNMFKVLINDEGQYSIWPDKKDAPKGWKEKGVSGSKEDVTKYIDENWTDLRPTSLQEAMKKAK